MDNKPVEASDFQFMEVSLVPASKCGACGEGMERYDDLHWACRAETCSEVGKSVHTGVYPVKECA